MNVQAQFIERNNCIGCGSNHVSEVSSGRYVDKPLVDFLNSDPWGESPLPYLQEAQWRLGECSDCGQVFHMSILNEEWNQRRFSEWMSASAINEFEEKHGVNSPHHRFNQACGYVEHILRIESLTRDIRDEGPVRLLDFGCGYGKFLAMCTQFGFDAVGVDRATPRIEGAVVKVFPTLNDLPRTNSFHAISLFEVLEHVDAPGTILAELKGYLAPGGLLILETPDCTGVKGIDSHSDYSKIHPLEHINAFTHATLKLIAERHRFKEVTRGGAFVTPSVARAAKRIAKYALGRDGKSTQLYFRKLP